MIIQSAIQLQCATLWSEDLNSQQQYTDLQVVNTFI